MIRNCGGKVLCLAVLLMVFTFSGNVYAGGGGENTIGDIVLHYSISAELSFASCMFITIKKPEMSLAAKYVIGGSVAALAGIGKEFVDKGRDQFDPADLGWDFLGVGTGIVLHWLIIDRKIQKGNVTMRISDKGFMAGYVLYF